MYRRHVTQWFAVLLLACCIAAGAHGETPPSKRTLAGAGPDQRVDSGAKVVMAGNGRSANGRVVRFAWTQVGGPRVALRNANHSTANFTAPTVNVTTVLRFRLAITDNRGETASSTASITVVPQTPAPPKKSES
jgi:chitinase